MTDVGECGRSNAFSETIAFGGDPFLSIYRRTAGIIFIYLFVLYSNVME